MASPHAERRSLALALLAALAMTASRARADEPTAAAAAEAAVVAAEKDPAQIPAAKVAVDAAAKAAPHATGPLLLLARVSVAEALAAKKGDEKKAAYQAALASLSKAQDLDLRDPAPWRLRVDVLTAMSTGRDEMTEALRALAIRLPGDPKARENYRRQTGKLPALRAGDPMPLVVWKDSAGKDVAVADLWANRLLVVELFRTTTWCEFCRRRLFELHDHAGDFEANNVTLVAVSPDPAEVIAAVEKDGLKGKKPFKVRLLSDPRGAQGDKLGVLNPEYAQPSTKPDLFGLPHPTTIVVDQAGVIRFIEMHEDFKNRTKVDEIIAAVGRARSPVAPR